MTHHPPPSDWDSLSFPHTIAWHYGEQWFREYPSTRDVPPDKQHLLRPYTARMLSRRLADGGDMPEWFEHKEQD